METTEPKAPARGVPVSQAARQLGVSVATLRKRVQRGRISAYKVDGQWMVVLPTVASVASESPVVSPGTDARTELDTVQQARFVHAMQEHARLLALSEEQATALRDQAATLRDQAQTIEAQRTTIAELTARLLTLTQATPAATEPAPTPSIPATETDATPPSSAGWWAAGPALVWVGRGNLATGGTRQESPCAP
jgi:excisionase family DNA binding protein